MRMSLMGWRDDDQEWLDAFEYFLTNNPVFMRMVYTELTGAEVPGGPGDVIVHEGVVDAPVAAVWDAFTTREGLESWMVPHARIDLRVGGRMLTNYDADGYIGDENTIENTILSFEPQRMMSIKATKPPANFPFKAPIENMWSVMYFEPAGDARTRVRCVGLGYGADEESQKMRGYFEQGNAWTIKKLQEHFASKTTTPAAGCDPGEGVVAVGIGRPGPNWVPGKPAQEQPHFGKHVVFLNEQESLGTVAVAAPFEDLAGGIVMIRTSSLSEAKEILTNEPFGRHGVVDWDVRIWLADLEGISVPAGQTVSAPQTPSKETDASETAHVPGARGSDRPGGRPPPAVGD
jgi:uncharacterized protein YndB with AHSA1/START domain/uncharacterized protein YciI